MPSTSQVTVSKFLEIYQRLLEQDYQILSILISSKLSGTVNSAIQAKSMLPPEAPVEIVDSNSIAMAMGFHLLTVARAMKQGATLPECVELAKKAAQHTGIFFAVDTLEFLHRGGGLAGQLGSWEQFSISNPSSSYATAGWKQLSVCAPAGNRSAGSLSWW